MSVNNKYCVYFGTVRGVLGSTNCKTDEQTYYELKENEKSEITCLEWGRTKDEILIGHKNGKVKLYSSLYKKYTHTLEDLNGEGPVTGIAVINNSLLIARENGIINQWSKMQSNYFSTDIKNDGTLAIMVSNCNAKNIIGTGGEKNDLKLWDVETKIPIFKTKSMGHDDLNLSIPTSIRGLCFYPNENNLISCVTKEGYVLLYDDRVQRRPITKFFESKASYTSVACTYRERQCIVGTTKGYVQLLDLRAPIQCVKTYKSFTGSVTSLICDPCAPVVISTCLDRYLRIHSLNTKALLFKKYMKQSLTKVIMQPLIKEENITESEDIDGVDCEYEHLFENMEMITENHRTKRKISVANSKQKKIKDE